jgi:hypothetical protein
MTHSLRSTAGCTPVWTLGQVLSTPAVSAMRRSWPRKSSSAQTSSRTSTPHRSHRCRKMLLKVCIHSFLKLKVAYV